MYYGLKNKRREEGDWQRERDKRSFYPINRVSLSLSHLSCLIAQSQALFVRSRVGKRLASEIQYSVHRRHYPVFARSCLPSCICLNVRKEQKDVRWKGGGYLEILQPVFCIFCTQISFTFDLSFTRCFPIKDRSCERRLPKKIIRHPVSLWVHPRPSGENHALQSFIFLSFVPKCWVTLIWRRVFFSLQGGYICNVGGLPGGGRGMTNDNRVC